MMGDREMLAALQAAEAAGLSASMVTGCSCDFCTGAKKHEDNWCPWCGKVQLQLPKWWENMDPCDDCARSLKEGTP